MAGTIKVKAQANDGEVIVKALIEHPMETGLRRDSSGNFVPAHFIQELTAEHNGQPVLKAMWGTGISKRPYISFKFKGGAPGDELKLSWVDNKGQSDSIVTQIQ